MNSTYDRLNNSITYLQYHCRNLEQKIAGYESGDRYLKLKRASVNIRRYYERRIRELKAEVEEAHIQTTEILRKWFEVFQDLETEEKKRLEAMERTCRRMEERALKAEQKNAEFSRKISEKNRELTGLREQLQDEKEKNENLKATMNQNFKNSSTPSSRTSFREKVTNNREHTDRKPGGQPGHEGHPRPSYDEADESVFIPAPPEILDDPDYYQVTGEHAKTHKKLVCLQFVVKVIDYWCYNYRRRSNGTKYHPPFPDGLVLETNYDGGIKGLAAIMKNHLNVSEEKISEFLSKLTDGKVRLSRGMINEINEEFSRKTEEERKKIFSDLLNGKVLNTDMTCVRENGENKTVLVCTNGDDTLYFYRDTKGFKAIEGTPVESFSGTLCHDHDKTFYHYGGSHQECNEHHLRYLKGVMENEAEREWAPVMRSLLQEMNRVRNEQEGMLSEEQILSFEKRYDDCVALALREYEDLPPSTYYRKGINLANEFHDYRDSILLFLHDPDVPFTNNVSEQKCRQVKRHMVNSGTFRSYGDSHSGNEFCDFMSVLQTVKARGDNIYDYARDVYNRVGPHKERYKREKEKQKAAEKGESIKEEG